MDYIIFGAQTKKVYDAGMFTSKSELRRLVLGIKVMNKNAGQEETLVVAQGEIQFSKDSDFVGL